jgi:hypothetical protein
MYSGLRKAAFFSDLWLLLLSKLARIGKSLRRPGVDSKEPIPPAYVAWRSGTSNKVVALARQAGNQFPGSLKGLQIRILFYFLQVYRQPRGTFSTWGGK